MNKSSIVNEYEPIISVEQLTCGKLSRRMTRLCNEADYCLASYSELAKKGKGFAA